MTDRASAGGSRAGWPAGWPAGDEALALQVVKVSPEGHEATRYPGMVVPHAAASPWICVRAEWTHGTVEVGELIFRTGDVLLEYFSPEHWFNVFALFSPEHELRGWYANVTHPTRFDVSTEPPTLSWHDLYLDLVAVPEGLAVVRDEDELEESRLGETDPELHGRIVLAIAEVAMLHETGDFPFHGAGPGDSL